MFLKKEFLINFLISIIPVTFIAGNLILNLNILLIILLSIFFYGTKIFKEKFFLEDKLIIIFFIYILLNGVINDFLNQDSANIILIKSISYLRFLILYFIIKFLIRKNIINFKYIFSVFGLVSLFVVLDLIVQYSFDRSLLGYPAEPSKRRLSGPFGDEYIAGAFIQRFYIFTIYFILLFSKFKETKIQNFLIYAAILIFLFGTLLAGNRVPLIMFILTLFLFFIFEKRFLKQSLIIFIFSFLIIFMNINLNKNKSNHYTGFVVKSIEIKDYLLKRFSAEKLDYIPNTYAKEIETGLLVWQQNRIFGGGIKSFYFNCAKIQGSIMDRYGGINCSSHPHNYFLQIMSELGLVGLLMSIIIFGIIALKSLKIIFLSKKSYFNQIMTPFFIVFIAELFPIKTTGSFFTSAISTFLFIIMAIIVSLNQMDKDKL